MNAKGDLNRSVRSTKRALQNAVVTLLKEKPIEAITVRELTELADVNRSTFYLHYRDVYDLLEQMEQRALEAMQEFLTSEALHDVSADGYPMVERIFSYLYEQQERFIVLFGPNGRKEAKRQAIQANTEYLVKVLTEDCGFARTEEMEMGARFVFEGGFGVLEQQYYQGKPFNSDTLVQFYSHITAAIFKAYRADVSAN